MRGVPALPGSAQAVESLNAHVARVHEDTAAEEQRRRRLPRHTVEVVVPQPPSRRRTGIPASQTVDSG